MKNIDNECKLFLNQRISEFEGILNVTTKFSDNFLLEVKELCKYLILQQLRPIEDRTNLLFASVNWKFRTNSNSMKKFYGYAVKLGVSFNYHQKKNIQFSFDCNSLSTFKKTLSEFNLKEDINKKLIGYFTPISHDKTIEIINTEINAPTRLRKPKGNRDISLEIYESVFAAFLYSSVPEKVMHRFFDPLFNEKSYCSSYWDELHMRSPSLFSRDAALYILTINNEIVSKCKTYIQFRNNLNRCISEYYKKINNYGYLSILIEPVKIENRWIQWELAADIILYAEKHIESRLKKAYFRSKDIAEKTSDYIKNVELNDTSFHIANEGFTYKDCFVTSPSAGDSSINETIPLLIFQKNHRDESEIFCPKCRSNKVRGNSYPSFGVKSWECKNLLCPDKSKYNRGKRYSFKGLVSQQAIDDELNLIPKRLVKTWVRDVQQNKSTKEIFEMLFRFYSLFGDNVTLINCPDLPEENYGRKIINSSFPFNDLERQEPLLNKSFFNRYLVSDDRKNSILPINLGDDDFQVFEGDSFEVLQCFEDDYFDGVVTSPPYYNAREYSQWDNIYCYLYDMYNVNREVYRCLKPGALYLYNIFDYFDNERSVTFSAMGQNRMILSAYTVNMFKTIGFRCLGNTAWDKGDIEGKRGFNAGNFSPYYQAPFNCWEHVLIFVKPCSSTKGQNPDLPGILKTKPVFKMVNGKNTYGHSAPYPPAIPELLIKLLPKGSIVLDPFGGSLTTGRVAEKNNISSVCIEKSIDYCNIGLSLREKEKNKAHFSKRQQDLPLIFK